LSVPPATFLRTIFSAGSAADNDEDSNFGNDTVDADLEGVPGLEKLEDVSFDADLKDVPFDGDLEGVGGVPGLEKGEGNDTVEGDLEGVPGLEKEDDNTVDGDLEGVPGLEKGDEDLVEHDEPDSEAAGRQSCSAVHAMILLHCCSAGFLAMILSIVAIRC